MRELNNFEIDAVTGGWDFWAGFYCGMMGYRQGEDIDYNPSDPYQPDTDVDERFWHNSLGDKGWYLIRPDGQTMHQVCCSC